MGSNTAAGDILRKGVYGTADLLAKTPWYMPNPYKKQAQKIVDSFNTAEETQSALGSSALKTKLNQYEATKPGTYQSQYSDKIKDVGNQLSGMGNFSYDPLRDTAYEQYKNAYGRAAKQANENAQANAAALTGGYGSSYGTQAGQSAYEATMSNLDSVLDNLYDQALSEYTQKKSNLQTRLSGYQNAEQQDYQNYQTDLANWYDGLAYRQSEYNNAVQQEQQERALKQQERAQKAQEKQNKTSNWINVGTAAASLALQILPYVLAVL